MSKNPLIRITEDALKAMKKHLKQKKRAGVHQWPFTFASKAIEEKVDREQKEQK